MKSFWLGIYYLVFSNLPSSYFPGGKIYNKLRILSLKKVLKLGSCCKIQQKVYIGDGNSIVIGSNTQINENVRLNNVIIGDYVMIAPGVTILGKMHDHSRIDIPMILQGEKACNPSVIENDVWIATNAIIMPGVKIGTGTIIGAGAVVTKDCDSFSIYVGIPAKKIKSREESSIDQK